MLETNFRQHAWEYFQLHASQRLTTFNYYIVISTLITTGILATFSKDYAAPFLGIAGGLLLAFFSFVFWKLDDRNKQIIKGAEAALKFYEDTSGLVDSSDGPNVLKLFTRDDFLTGRRRHATPFWPWRRHFSYTTSFNRVFWAFAIFGLLGAGVSAYESESLGSNAIATFTYYKGYVPAYLVGLNVVFFFTGVIAGIGISYLVARLVIKNKRK